MVCKSDSGSVHATLDSERMNASQMPEQTSVARVCQYGNSLTETTTRIERNKIKNTCGGTRTASTDNTCLSKKPGAIFLGGLRRESVGLCGWATARPGEMYQICRET